jgi:hypothetical protein
MALLEYKAHVNPTCSSPDAKIVGLAQLKATHPEIELPKNTNDALAAVENLAKRNKVSCYAPLFQPAADFLCLSDHPSTLSPMSSHPDWQEAEIFDVGVCAGFLFGINARNSVGAGWGTCAQICCDDGDKVFACNDVSAVRFLFL